MITQDPKYLQPLIDAFGEQIQNEIDKWDTGDRYQRAEQIGYHFSGILLAVIGTKGVDKVLEILKTGKRDLECNCFTAGTLILTDEGEKPIEEIKVGDKVLSRNEETGEQAYKEVTHLFCNEKEIIYEITVDNQVIETTDNHPFWVEGRGWVLAVDLQVVDKLQQENGNNTLTIDKINIVKHDEMVKVYNFTVADFHTYFVSDLGIMVHNIRCIW
jgi:hypothetical protein